MQYATTPSIVRTIRPPFELGGTGAETTVDAVPMKMISPNNVGPGARLTPTGLEPASGTAAADAITWPWSGKTPSERCGLLGAAGPGEPAGCPHCPQNLPPLASGLPQFVQYTRETLSPLAGWGGRGQRLRKARGYAGFPPFSLFGTAAPARTATGGATRDQCGGSWRFRGRPPGGKEGGSNAGAVALEARPSVGGVGHRPRKRLSTVRSRQNEAQSEAGL
jgi:hypothetical protein